MQNRHRFFRLEPLLFFAIACSLLSWQDTPPLRTLSVMRPAFRVNDLPLPGAPVDGGLGHLHPVGRWPGRATGAVEGLQGLPTGFPGLATRLGATARACQRVARRGFAALGHHHNVDFPGFQAPATLPGAHCGLCAAVFLHPGPFPTVQSIAVAYHNERPYTTRLWTWRSAPSACPKRKVHPAQMPPRKRRPALEGNSMWYNAFARAILRGQRGNRHGPKRPAHGAEPR